MFYSFVFRLLATKIIITNHRRIMGKSKRGVRYTRKEKEQAKRALLIIGVSALILALAILIGSSFLGR